MIKQLSPRLGSVLLALLVTVLWSTSWVLIRIGLADLPPLSFAGLRYTLAFLCLLPFATRGRQLELLGLVAACTGTLSNALSSVLGRYVNRGDDLSPLSITVVTMGIGSVWLLAVGMATQGLPRLTPANGAIVGWLAVVNSALAWLFRGKRLTLAEVTGIALAMTGTLVVQVCRQAAPQRQRNTDDRKELADGRSQ